MNKMYIYELMQELNYTDVRPVLKWCKKNNIEIIKVGKAKFIYEIEYRKVCEKTIIDKLKKQYGKEWETYYQIYQADNIVEYYSNTTLPIQKGKPNKSTNKIENNSLNKLKEYAKIK